MTGTGSPQSPRSQLQDKENNVMFTTLHMKRLSERLMISRRLPWLQRNHNGVCVCVVALRHFLKKMLRHQTER